MGLAECNMVELLGLTKLQPFLLASGFRNNRLGNPPLPRHPMGTISAGKPMVSIFYEACDHLLALELGFRRQGDSVLSECRGSTYLCHVLNLTLADYKENIQISNHQGIEKVDQLMLKSGLEDMDWSIVLPLEDSVHTTLLGLFLVILSKFFISQ